MECVARHAAFSEGLEEHVEDGGGKAKFLVDGNDVVADGEGAEVVGAVEGDELAEEGACFGEEFGAGEDVEEEAEGGCVGAVVGVLGDEVEEGEGGSRVEAEAA